jgi:hypothetical protein
MRQVNSSMIRDNTGADYRWVRRGLTLETENNKCDKHVFEQGRNGFVTIFPTSEYSPWGITHLSIPNCTTFTYVSRPYSLHVESPNTAFVLPCPDTVLTVCPFVSLRLQDLSVVFSSLPPRHVIPCSPFRIMIVESWGSGSRIKKVLVFGSHVLLRVGIPRGKRLRLKSPAFLLKPWR